MRRLILPTFLAILVSASSAFAQNGPYQYFPLTPCRAVDTRGPVATNGGPALDTGTVRDFQMKNNCGVPATAKAVSLNVTVTQATQSSWLAAWPSGQPRPIVSMINFEPSDPALANGIIVGLSTNTADLSVINASGRVHVLIDVTGYFQ